MPKDPSLHKILVLGSGPIVIGQGCEFDYSGNQACKALKEEGCFVILANSNPATVMTDPTLAHATYIEPLTVSAIEKIIDKERPDALLPTMGGQTALNITRELFYKNILSRYNVRVIGLSLDTLELAEDRKLFRETLSRHGLPTLPCFHINCLEQINDVDLPFPLIVRASFTLGGYGGGLAMNREELYFLCKKGLAISPSGVLIEPSIEGWKEFEVEVIRDNLGNSIVVCGIENIDPMGVHTGDSTTVSPIQTLTDKEYQAMRSCAFQVMASVGMTAGGCNVQFAVHPMTGEMVCIEINPRVSRSSALASKATSYPIAKISTKLALGYSLTELRCHAKGYSAFFEPSLDYVTVKIPLFPFDTFPQCSRRLTSSMKAIGEAMAIGRTFREALRWRSFSSVERAVSRATVAGFSCFQEWMDNGSNSCFDALRSILFAGD